jgi:hypothetical protein
MEKEKTKKEEREKKRGVTKVPTNSSVHIKQCNVQKSLIIFKMNVVEILDKY